MMTEEYKALLKGSRWKEYPNREEKVNLIRQGLVWGDPPHEDDEAEIDDWVASYLPHPETHVTSGAAFFKSASPIPRPTVRQFLTESSPRSLFSTVAVRHAEAEAGFESALRFRVLLSTGEVYGTFHWGVDGWAWS